MSRMEQMLRDISIIDFTVVDLSLYLDTHPDDHTALEYFNHYNRINHQMKKEFSKLYYPLSLQYADGNDDFRWATAPMPWEGVC